MKIEIDIHPDMILELGGIAQRRGTTIDEVIKQIVGDYLAGPMRHNQFFPVYIQPTQVAPTTHPSHWPTVINATYGHAQEA